MTTLTHPELVGSCQIVDSGVFEEYLSIRPIDAVHGNAQVPGGVFSEVECMVVTLPSRRVPS